MDYHGPFALTPELLARLKPHFEDQEGRENCIYPDSEGNPTTGIGHLLATAGDAMKLTFQRADGKPASQAEIRAAWLLVKSTGRRVQNVFLSEVDIDALFLQDLKRFLPVLVKNFGTLVDVPQQAVIALYDMAFNLGGFYEFPRLRMAVLAEDWMLAAEESHRLGIGARRNKLTRALLLQAAGKPPETQRA
jgi:GH24 family phage-related lysozyme (muramidase)